MRIKTEARPQLISIILFITKRESFVYKRGKKFL